MLVLVLNGFDDMDKTASEVKVKTQSKTIQLHGKGLLSKGEVNVSISKLENGSGIVFILNNEKIYCDVQNVLNANRNTVLTNGKESICLVEHFLAACSLLGVNDIEVITDKNELIFGDGSALHWQESFLNTGFLSSISQKRKINKPIFIKNGDKEIVAIPHDGFKVSYFMDYDHPALSKLWASWELSEGKDTHTCLLRARTFAKKEENDFFGASDWLLTFDENGFNKKLHEPLEPVHHKILDIIGDIRLCGVNPLEINMHVIGFKSGHALNVEMARELSHSLQHLS